MSFNLATIQEALAAAVPDRECIVHGDRRVTWDAFNTRTRRLANFLLAWSYVDRLCVGVLACPDLLPDPHVISEGLHDALADLCTASRNVAA